LYRFSLTSADESLPPELVFLGLIGIGRGRWRGGDDDDAGLAFPDEAQLLTGHRLDVLVGPQVLAEGLETLIALLETRYLALQPALPLAQTTGTEENA
jgi:hypothetical protein